MVARILGLGLVLLTLGTGCLTPSYSSDWLPFGSARELNTLDPDLWRIRAVLKTDGEILDFAADSNARARFVPEGISFRLLAAGGERKDVLLQGSQVRGVMLTRYDYSSCPLVYVRRNGEWVLIGEPLGGAVTAGLSRWETLALGPGDDPFGIMLANVNREIQYLDCVEVLAVKTAGLALPRGIAGLSTVDRPRPAARACANETADILERVARPDGRTWTGHYCGGATRDEIRIEFDEVPPAPALVVTAGATPLESQLVADLLRLRGAQREEWYRRIDRDPAQALGLLAWTVREEVHVLKVEARTATGTWAAVGSIFSGGPVVLPRRVVPLDLPDDVALPLTLRVHPPKGLWEFDEISIASVVDERPVSRKLLPVSGLPRELAAADGKTNEMRPGGPPLVIEYPPPLEGETAVLKIRGYYRILVEEGPSDPETLDRIEKRSGEVVRYAHRQRAP